MSQPTFSIRELAERAKREGAYDLAQGVIDAPPPQALIDAIKNLPVEKCSIYNNKRGVPEFRKSVQHYLNQRGWKIGIENIVATSGVMGGIAATLLTECRPGDTVLLPEPFFVYHRSLLEALGFKPRIYTTPLDEAPDWEEILRLFSEVDAAIITTPANPSGQFVPTEIRNLFATEAQKTNTLVIFDEIYREFRWDEEVPNDSEYIDLPLDKTVILRSFSKTFAIPGWRVGFAVTSPAQMERIAATHDYLYIGGSTIAQHALAEALQNYLEDLNKYLLSLRKQLIRNKGTFEDAFRSYGMEPLPVPGAYYMLIKHNRASDIEAMEELIAKKIVTTPVNILYSDSSKDTGYIRAHFGVSEKTAQAVHEILTTR